MRFETVASEVIILLSAEDARTEMIIIIRRVRVDLQHRHLYLSGLNSDSSATLVGVFRSKRVGVRDLLVDPFGS